MNISIIGTGYVGLVAGACFAKMGNSVVCADKDKAKIAALSRGVIPIYEPGLEELVREDMGNGSLAFTANLPEAIRQADICFIAVGTPMGESGEADLRHVLSVAEEIGRYMEKPLTVVDKSTVPVGTADRVRDAIAGSLRKRGISIHFDVVSNPEFLKEGAALSDFLKPDRVVIGVPNDRSLAVMRELYAPFTRNHDNLLVMDIRSAEMTKYAANAMLACRISFINEIANLCERVGADVNHVRLGIGSDSRIGYAFLYPGCGYGGSCFPKDVRALIGTSREYGYEPELIASIEAVNNRQKMIVADKVLRRFGERLDGRVFAVWGLAFKPGTDDMRESPAISIISGLTGLGAGIRVYDPKAMEHARAHYFKGNHAITYCHDKYETLQGADALLLLTEWGEFRQPDFGKMKASLREPVLFDGRNQYSMAIMQRAGFEYHPCGMAMTETLAVMVEA